MHPYHKNLYSFTMIPEVLDTQQIPALTFCHNQWKVAPLEERKSHFQCLHQNCGIPRSLAVQHTGQSVKE